VGCLDDILRLIKNILKDNEVDKKSNMQKMHIANSDKTVNFYTLDIILAVGYMLAESKGFVEIVSNQQCLGFFGSFGGNKYA